MTAPTAPESTATQTGLNAFKPRIVHTAFHVSKIDRALAFYVGALGMKEQMRLDLSPTLHEVVLTFPDSKGGGVILMWNSDSSQPRQLGDGYSRVVVTVSDVDAALQHLAQHEARVVSPAKDAGPMRYAMVQDPDGYVIELLQLKRG